MNITNQNQQDPENYTADQNKQDTNNTELSPDMSPVTYKKEEPLLVRAVVDNFSAFGVGSILYGLFFCFCIYQNFRLFRGNGGLKTSTTPVFIPIRRHSTFG